MRVSRITRSYFISGEESLIWSSSRSQSWRIEVGGGREISNMKSATSANTSALSALMMTLRIMKVTAAPSKQFQKWSLKNFSSKTTILQWEISGQVS